LFVYKRKGWRSDVGQAGREREEKEKEKEIKILTSPCTRIYPGRRNK
jgi:hypothetical protein